MSWFVQNHAPWVLCCVSLFIVIFFLVLFFPFGLCLRTLDSVIRLGGRMVNPFRRGVQFLDNRGEIAWLIQPPMAFTGHATLI
jgi:hypothetical protein